MLNFAVMSEMHNMCKQGDDDDEADLPPADPASDRDDERPINLPHPLPQIPFAPHGPGGVPIVPLPFRGRGHAIPFVRVGFAGRGAGRGRGGGGRGDGGGGGAGDPA